MEREILFRGKSNVHLGWVEGHYHRDFWNKESFIHCNGIVCDVDEETVTQFTGLLDKNGKKIFEGDVVSYKDYNGYEERIEIKEEVLFGGGSFHPICLMPSEEFKVIGNRWDNPELLK